MISQNTDAPRQPSAEAARNVGEGTAERNKDASDSIQEMAANAAEQARQYSEKAQDAIRQFKPFVEKSLKERPAGTLAGAAAIGFLLGALWKR